MKTRSLAKCTMIFKINWGYTLLQPGQTAEPQKQGSLWLSFVMRLFRIPGSREVLEIKAFCHFVHKIN